MVYHLIKSQKSTPISHYGEPYSGIEDYDLKKRNVKLTDAVELQRNRIRSSILFASVSLPYLISRRTYQI